MAGLFFYVLNRRPIDGGLRDEARPQRVRAEVLSSSPHLSYSLGANTFAFISSNASVIPVLSASNAAVLVAPNEVGKGEFGETVA